MQQNADDPDEESEGKEEDNPLVNFGAFVVLPEKDGNKGNAKLLGSADLNLAGTPPATARR